MTSTSERHNRARAFREIVAATGLSPVEFRERSGITRNVYYNLSIGQEPKPHHISQINETFERLGKPRPL